MPATTHGTGNTNDKDYIMGRKKFNPATTQMADGAMPAIHSAYELMGIKNIKYRERSFAAYQSQLRRMNMVELHDHAFEVGVLAGSSKETVIANLERKFLQENPAEREGFYARRNSETRPDAELSVEERAERIMEQAR